MLRFHAIIILWLLLSSFTNAEDAVTTMMNATFKITNKDSTATCFVIAPPKSANFQQQEYILLTAAHVFKQMTGDECRIVLRKKLQNGTYARDEVAIKIRSQGEALWSQHATADVAALKFTLPKDHDISALAWDQIADKSLVQKKRLRCADEIWIPGYPAQLEANKAGFPVLRRGNVASYPLAPIRDDGTYLISANTCGGDSGAPVMVFNRKKETHKTIGTMVVGLVTGLHRETMKTNTPYEERTVHRPLGLAIVIHAEFLRQTAERLWKAEGESQERTVKPRK